MSNGDTRFTNRITEVLSRAEYSRSSQSLPLENPFQGRKGKLTSLTLTHKSESARRRDQQESRDVDFRDETLSLSMAPTELITLAGSDAIQLESQLFRKQRQVVQEFPVWLCYRGSNIRYLHYSKNPLPLVNKVKKTLMSISMLTHHEHYTYMHTQRNAKKFHWVGKMRIVRGKKKSKKGFG
ncbi:hypothetical protein STEG23_029794, partial [Scotinomys teguina]